jgi:hypothetical protein
MDNMDGGLYLSRTLGLSFFFLFRGKFSLRFCQSCKFSKSALAYLLFLLHIHRYRIHGPEFIASLHNRFYAGNALVPVF